MSREEIQQQAQTITGIHDSLSNLNLKFDKWVKLLAFIGAIGTVVGAIGGFAIGAYKYDANIVKQPQLAHTVGIMRKVDSALNAKIDHNEIKDSVRFQKIVFRAITQFRGKDGRLHIKPAPSIY